MAREVKLALMYRDMWQSSGKYMPTSDQLEIVASPIIQMGCFDRVETNGGGFEQINLLYGQNPNHSVRRWTQPFNEAGIQTQMLERGLNGLRMSPVPRDVRKLMFELKKKQGTDIARSFDGLNNPQNLELSFQYAREGNMIAQGALCISHSPLHTVEYYTKLADEYIDLGAEEFCIKDMAGIGRPVSIGNIVKNIRKRHPKVLIQYHGHSTPGFSVASSLQAALHGADIIDVGMEPLSWGTGHADLLTIHAMLKDAGFIVKDINMKAYMEVRRLSQEFIDDFLGFFINPRNRNMNSLLIGPGLPGGMMGSLMSDLETNLASLNKWLAKRDKEIISEDDFLIKLFEEVKYIWPKLGYPPLVTPYSQYVKNTALMNVIQMVKDNPRWSIMDENTWDMILGKSGSLLGPVAPELKEMAKSQGREFFTGNPQDLYPDQLPEFSRKMKEHNWNTGPDDEELFEYAMHPKQYEAFKSGAAKKGFEESLQDKMRDIESPEKSASEIQDKPDKIRIELDGVRYEVNLNWTGQESRRSDLDISKNESDIESSNGHGNTILSPLEGKFYLTKDSHEKPLKVGDEIHEGDTIAYIESMKVINAITADKDGVIADILVKEGQDIEEDEVIFKLV